MSNTRETIESSDENKELAEIKKKPDKTMRYLIDNKKELEKHYNIVLSETEDKAGINSPAKNFRLEVIKSWSGSPFTKDEFDEIDPGLASEFYDEIFKIQQRLQNEQKQKELNPSIPEEPEELKGDSRQDEMGYFQKKAKTHFRKKGFFGPEAAHPEFREEEKEKKRKLK